MILDALTAQINQRFQHEKRARVCLWFDPSREFARLIPKFGGHLAQLSAAPFSLLEYDSALSHGQFWLKHRVHTELAGLTEAERKIRRFLIYLPVSEDRLDSPDAQGKHHLELLEEYRVAGLIWRIGGKRPSLFRCLRQAGVKLPTSPPEQRKLYKGGFDSLLAKYVAKYAEQPAAHWHTQLTPGLAQTRILGDIDQTLIEIAIAPKPAWEALQVAGLESEFVAAVATRYGFARPGGQPVAWIQAFVTDLALTETYQGYEEPDDFPFLDRLPPAPLRVHHTQLLRRWLRDSKGRIAWDRWVVEVEKDVDLSAWASQRVGLSFAFPHVVRGRWRQTHGALRDAASRTSTTEKFFADHLARIKLEAEYSHASDQPVGAWGLLVDLANLLDASRDAERDVAGAPDTSALAQLYVRNAGCVEQQHLVLRREAQERSLPVVASIADRHYASYTNALNSRFFEAYAKQGNAEIDELPGVTHKLERDLWSVKGRRAVVIVDALRFDCALAIRDELRDHDVVVDPMRAELPTITPVGMTALMPLSSATVTLETKGNNVHPRVNGKDCSQRKQRLAFLTEFGADCRDIETIENASEAPDALGDLLVVYGHDQVDHMGHGSGDDLVRHVEAEVRRIVRLMRRLHSWGYEAVHVVTDHGFILLEESKLPDVVDCDKNWCQVRKERFALVPETADIPLASFPSPWDSSVRVAVPPGLAFFKAEKSFSHGGAALQELVIPHLTSKPATQQEKRIGVEVVLPTYELTRAAVKVILRPISTTKTDLNQMPLFTEAGRTLTFDVRRVAGSPGTVLAKSKELSLGARDTEKSVTLFFKTTQSFEKGELLTLDIRDADTAEQFPPGAIKLSVGRDM